MKAARMIHRWQGILDRYDAQERGKLEEGIAFAAGSIESIETAVKTYTGIGEEWFRSRCEEDLQRHRKALDDLTIQLHALGGES